MARTFSGSNQLRCSIGANNFVMGPGTVALVLRPTAGIGNCYLFWSGNTNSGTARWALEMNASRQVIMQCGANTSTGTTGATSTNWTLVAGSKATGSAAPRFHLYDYPTNGWTHENGGTSIADSGTPATNCYIGSGNPGGATAFTGDIAVVGTWAVVLTDSQVESLPFGIANWYAPAQPKGIWFLDQQVTTQSVPDVSGGGANQAALTGTSVATGADAWTPKVPIMSIT